MQAEARCVAAHLDVLDVKPAASWYLMGETEGRKLPCPMRYPTQGGPMKPLVDEALTCSHQWISWPKLSLPCPWASKVKRSSWILSMGLLSVQKPSVQILEVFQSLGGLSHIDYFQIGLFSLVVSYHSFTVWWFECKMTLTALCIWTPRWFSIGGADREGYGALRRWASLEEVCHR